MCSSRARPCSTAKPPKLRKGAPIMPAISLVSADNLADAAEEFAAEVRRAPKPPRKALVPEASHAALARALQPIATSWRQSSLYRMSLRGRIPEQIYIQAFDSRAARLEDADAYF